MKFATRWNNWIARYSEEITQKYESGYPADPRIFSLENKSYRIYGTWHNYDYSSIMPRLRKDFEFRELPSKWKRLGEKILSCNSVSIHVRKGDYIRYGLDILDLSWYQRAIDRIKEKVEQPVFFVFSDENVKEEFDRLGCDFFYVTGNKGDRAYVDMQLMSMCRHNIIANSTFSYWAALLNQNPEKIVIRPYMQTKNKKTWTVKDWILLQ